MHSKMARVFSLSKTLGARLRFWVFGGSSAGRYLGVSIGSDCRIYTCSFGSEPWLIRIGDRVTITSGVQLLTHDGSTCLATDDRGRRYHYAPIEIGDDVFIGIRAILMPGVRVGNRCVIGAGAVVTRSVPSGCVVAGSPARIVGRFNDLMQSNLENRPCAADMKGRTYRERIDSVLDGFRPEMSLSN